MKLTLILMILIIWVASIASLKLKKRKRYKNKTYNSKDFNEIKPKEISFEERAVKKVNQAYYYDTKDKFWDSKEEREIFKLLNEMFEDKVMILPHVSLRELFAPKDLSYSNRAHLSVYHIDFLVVTKGTLRPLVAVELDGVHHEDESQVLNDIFKDELVKKYDIDMIRIKSREYDKESLKKIIIKSIRKAPIYCKVCGARMIKRIGINGKSDFYGCSNYSKNNCRNTENINYKII